MSLTSTFLKTSLGELINPFLLNLLTHKLIELTFPENVNRGLCSNVQLITTDRTHFVNTQITLNPVENIYRTRVQNKWTTDRKVIAQQLYIVVEHRISFAVSQYLPLSRCMFQL